MKYSGFLIIWVSLLVWTTDAQNVTNTLTKTKRNLSRDIQSYGESSLVFPLASNPKIYYEPKPMNTYYQARPLALVDFSQPVKVIEPKVASEQVLYEFQQTPTDSISNVHVKQLFQSDMKPPPPLPPNTSSPTVLTSETVVAPVQHTQYVQNHVQPFIKQHPLYNVQPTFIEPKKYVYGKIIVDSTHPQQNHFPQGPTAFHSNQVFVPHQSQGVQISHGKPIISYVNHFPRNNIHLKEQLPPNMRTQFRPPPISQHQTIDTPIQLEKPRNTQSKPALVEKPVIEDEEVEDTEENAEYEEDRDDYETPFEKYFDADEEDHLRDHESFEEDEEESEEDNKRGSSRYVSKIEHSPKKHRKSKKQKSSSKYGYPDEKYFKSDKFKYKYKHAKKSKYPRSELDARFSEPIPITHKKKILKEKWFLSKTLADKE